MKVVFSPEEQEQFRNLYTTAEDLRSCITKNDITEKRLVTLYEAARTGLRDPKKLHELLERPKNIRPEFTALEALFSYTALTLFVMTGSWDCGVPQEMRERDSRLIKVIHNFAKTYGLDPLREGRVFMEQEQEQMLQHLELDDEKGVCVNARGREAAKYSGLSVRDYAITALQISIGSECLCIYLEAYDRALAMDWTPLETAEN